MLSPSGSPPMTVTCGTRLTEGSGGHLRRGAVRGVDDDVQALEAVRQHGEQVRDVAVGAVDERA